MTKEEYKCKNQWYNSRNYYNKNHEFKILTIDSTYIPASYDSIQNTYIFQ